MLDLRPHDEGVLLKIRARPGSRHNTLRGVFAGRLVVTVTATAEKGRANRAIVATIAKETKIKKAQLLLISGHTDRDKVLLVRDWTVAALLHELTVGRRRQ